MRTYERPSLTKAGSFKKVTGLGGHGPRDVMARRQMLYRPGPLTVSSLSPPPRSLWLRCSTAWESVRAPEPRAW